MSINWDEEPAAIVGVTKAILELGAASGLALTSQSTGSIVAAVTAIATLAATFIVRAKVTSPASAKDQLAQAGVLSAKLAQFSATPFGGNGVAGYGHGFPEEPVVRISALDAGASEAFSKAGKAMQLLQAAAEGAQHRKALGRRPPKNAPALRFADHLATVPTHPIVDPAPNLDWPMDHNDTVGDCVIAGLDHALQAIYTTLDGSYANWSDAEMLTCYQTQNPKFKSWSQGGTSADGGMDIQTFLEYLVKQKVILGFAKVDHTNLAEVEAATFLGLGLVTGETLTSKNMNERTWDYHKGDPQEGGHCTVSVGYNPLEQQVSWGGLYSMTDAFFQKNVEEAWFVITQAHVDHPAFRAGFDLVSFAAAYKQLTGEDFPVAISVPPAPDPVTPPAGDATFQALVSAYPAAAAKVAKNAAARKMTEPEYLAWLVAKDLNLR